MPPCLTLHKNQKIYLTDSPVKMDEVYFTGPSLLGPKNNVAYVALVTS